MGPIPVGQQFRSFNSTLVQLKDQNNWVLISVNACFNSTLVQLKDSFFKRKNMEKTCFNSTLVQLKVIGSKV